MNDDKLAEWVGAYIQAQELDVVDYEHPLWWAIKKFMDLGESNPEACWLAVLGIVQQMPSEKVLSVLAAGPLEDLIDDHGPQFIDRIENEARRNSVFRTMLRNVWKSGSDDVWDRVQRAAGVT